MDEELKAVMKKEVDGEHPASHYLVVEDPEKPSTWHLRVRDVDGNLDHRLMGMAWAALHGGFRGNRYEGPNREEAIAKLRKLYEQEGMEPPNEREERKAYAVKILEESDGRARIGGYGIVWGGQDLVGDTFEPDTDLCLDVVPRKPVFYDHALRSIRAELGFTVKHVPDDFGLWVEAELERHREYVDMVLELVRRGALGWSSGAVAHLVERIKKNGRTVLKRWPIYEFSLTPTPAEPRTLGVEELKSISAYLPPEWRAGGAGQAPSPTAGTPTTHHGVKTTMDEPTPITATVPAEPQTPTPPLDAAALQSLIQSTVADAVKAHLAALPPANAAYAVTAPDTDEDVRYTKSAPAVLKNPRGDSEIKSLAAWIRTGDGGKFHDVWLRGDSVTIKASDAAMTVAVGADGGYAVPTGHFNNIIARRDEMLLANALGVRRIPGQGMTVNVPVDADAGVDFIATSEQNSAHGNNFPRRKPDIGQVAMTLGKYSLKVELTDELMQDEASNLMAFLEDYIARAMARTHNNLLLTEVANNGTQFKQFASATAIAAGEPQDILGNDNLAPYLDEEGCAWVGRSSTFWAIAKITGNPFLYAPTPAGGRRELLGYPFFYSAKAPAIGANAKPLFFGNWQYVGWREAPELTLVRDNISVDGILVLKYYFRTVYKVLVAPAIGYGKHPAS